MYVVSGVVVKLKCLFLQLVVTIAVAFPNTAVTGALDQHFDVLLAMVQPSRPNSTGSRQPSCTDREELVLYIGPTLLRLSSWKLTIWG